MVAAVEFPTSAPEHLRGDSPSRRTWLRYNHTQVQGRICHEDGKISQVARMWACQQPFVQEWNRCALIGGSSHLRKKNLGAKIDSYDTVIRVNRISSPEFFKDFGKRTDVLFIGPINNGIPMISWAGQLYRQMGSNDILLCDFKESCPFRALVLKGERPVRGNWDLIHPVGSIGWKPPRANFPIAYQDGDLNQFVWDLMQGILPTTGFQAILTFSLVCNTLDVYGFTGKKNADGHVVSKKHNLTREHELQRIIFGGDRAKAERIREELLSATENLNLSILQQVFSKSSAVRIME